MRSVFLLIALFVVVINNSLTRNGYAQVPGEATESFGDRLVIGVVDKNWKSLNPYQIDSPIQKDIMHLIFGYGLLQQPGKYDAPSSLINRIVYRSGEESDRVWRFVLKRNIFFQDGSDLRNTDVKFTFEVLKKFGGYILNRKFDFSNIRNISIQGDLELKFELLKPDKKFNEKLTDIPILYRRYYREILSRGYRYFSEKNPIGLGPFAFISRSANTLNLKFHPHYFSGRPFLDHITIRFFNNQQQLVNALVNGELDYIEIQDRVTAQQLHQLMGSKIIVFTVPRPEKKLYFMLMNIRKFPFSELAVRKAIYYALNRKQIVIRFLRQDGDVAHTLFDKDNPYFFRQAFRDEFDPSRAIRILTNAGWRLNKQTGILEKNGLPLTFKLYFSQNSFLEESIVRTIKIYLGELNINVQPVPIDQSQKEAFLNGNNFNAVIYNYLYDPEYLFQAVEHFYFNFLRGNPDFPNYKNKYLDRLFNLSYQNPRVRENLYQRFQYYVQKEMPAIFLFFDNRIIVAVNSRFRNVRTTFRKGESFFYRLNPLENWFVPKHLQKYEF